MSSAGIERWQRRRRDQVWPNFSMLLRFEPGQRKGGVLTPPSPSRGQRFPLPDQLESELNLP
jgi:hypothetical protein